MLSSCPATVRTARSAAASGILRNSPSSAKPTTRRKSAAPVQLRTRCWIAAFDARIWRYFSCVGSCRCFSQSSAPPGAAAACSHLRHVAHKLHERLEAHCQARIVAVLFLHRHQALAEFGLDRDGDRHRAIHVFLLGFFRLGPGPLPLEPRRLFLLRLLFRQPQLPAALLTILLKLEPDLLPRLGVLGLLALPKFHVFPQGLSGASGASVPASRR